MEALIELKNMCKCGVHLTINNHRDYYQPVESVFREYESMGSPIEVDEEIKAKMIESDTMIQLQFYPSTPIGFYVIWHYDLRMALKEAIELMNEERGLKHRPTKQSAVTGSTEPSTQICDK